MEREPERLFLRYRTDGDSSALAAVFDRAAPEILKVAIHLTSDAAEAEDLLQATFIVAIEKADRFDGSRRLVPWLLGILTNLWRQRRERRSPDPERLPRREADDPSAAAEQREVTEEVGKALERVPEPYRRVLRMRLQDGLEPAAIAHKLDRAPGTVRSQIHRGLDLLRRALPAGLAVGAVAATRGLAAVRADVLQAAVAAGPTKVALVGGLLMTKKKLVLIAALVLTLGGGVIVSQRWWGRAPATRSTEAREPVVSEAPLRDARPPRADGPDPAPGGTVASVPTEVKHVAGQGSVGVKVAWRAITEPSVEGLAIHVAVGTLFHETRATDTEGVAHFPRVPVGLAVATCLDASAAGGSTQVQAGRHADMTLYMSPPRRELVAVDGEVVDASGRPVAGAWILVPSLSAAMVVATTDEGGRFALPSIETGTYVQAGASGHAPSEPLQLTDARERVRLVLPGRGGTLVGRVVDATGQPVAGAFVDAHPNVRIRLRTITDARGRFHFEGMAPGALTFHVRCRGHAAWTGELATVAGSVTETEIKLEQGGVIYGQVTDGRRNPLPGIRLTVSKSMALAHSDREGSYRIEDVRPGPVRLIARTPRTGGMATATVEVVAGGETRRDITLLAPDTITGRLVDEAGDPLPGWRISLRANRFHLDQATVGEDGSFAFTKPTKPEHRFLLHVFASKEAKLPVLVVPDVKGSAKDLVIEIPADAVPSCHVTGRVADEVDTPPAIFRVALVDVESGAQATFDFEASDGAFRIGPVPPGTYDVLVFVHDATARIPLVYRAKSGPHALRAQSTLDLEAITVAAPGAIVLRLRPEDAEKFAGVTCWLKGTEVQRRAGVLPGAREIRIDDLPPGTYWATLNLSGMASVVLTDLAVEPRRTATHDLNLEAGVLCHLRFRMARAPEAARRLHVRAVDADGNCVMDDWYTQRGPGTYWAVTSAAPRTYTVEAETKTGERTRGQFTVPEGGTKRNDWLEVELN